MRFKTLAVALLSVSLAACASSFPNSANACEQYFVASDQVTAIVDATFDDLGGLTDEQRLQLIGTYSGAVKNQADKALLLDLALTSDGLASTSDGLASSSLGNEVDDLVALLSEQVFMLDFGGSDVTSLLRIQRLESQVESECKDIGANLP